VSDIAHFVKGSLIISIFSYKQQVSDIAHFVEAILISYDQQLVSDIAHFVKDILIASFPMTNSK